MNLFEKVDNSREKKIDDLVVGMEDSINDRKLVSEAQIKAYNAMEDYWVTRKEREFGSQSTISVTYGKKESCETEDR